MRRYQPDNSRFQLIELLHLCYSTSRLCHKLHEDKLDFLHIRYRIVWFLKLDSANKGPRLQLEQYPIYRDHYPSLNLSSQSVPLQRYLTTQGIILHDGRITIAVAIYNTQVAIFCGC